MSDNVQELRINWLKQLRLQVSDPKNAYNPLCSANYRVINTSERLGGAKADRRKEAAIATAVENFMNEILAEKDDGRMTRAKMVQELALEIFFNIKYCMYL